MSPFKIFILLFFLIFGFHSKSVNNSNDGAHYAAALNLSSASFEMLSSELPVVGSLAYAKKNDRLYPDKQLGLAILTAPAFAFAKTMDRKLNVEIYPSEVPAHQLNPKQNSEDIYPITNFGTYLLGAVSAAIAALGVCVSFYFMRGTAGNKAAGLGLGLLALGSPFLYYFSNSQATTLSITCVAILVAIFHEISKSQRPNWILAFGATSSATVFSEAHLVTFSLTMVSGFFVLQIRDISNLRASLKYFAMGALIPTLLYCYTNLIRFDSFFATAYQYHATYLYARDLGQLFSTPLISGLYGLLLDPNHHGILISQPYLIFSLYWVVKKSPLRCAYLVVLAACLVHICTVATLKEWDGGGNFPRYVAASNFVLAMMAITAIAALWQAFRTQSSNAIEKILLAFALVTIPAAISQHTDISAHLLNLATGGPIFDETKFRQIHFRPILNTSSLIFSTLIAAAIMFYVFTRMGLAGSLRRLSIPIAFLVTFAVGQQSPENSKKDFILNLSNFNAELFAEGSENHTNISIENMLTNGQFIYPLEFDRVGKITIPNLNQKSDRYLFVTTDITLVGEGNTVTYQCLSRGSPPVSIHQRTGTLKEKRYLDIFYMSMLGIPCETMEIKAVAHKATSKVPFDARIESIKVFSTRNR